MGCRRCFLQDVLDVALLQASLLGEELEAVSVERQMGGCDDDPAIILIS